MAVLAVPGKLVAGIDVVLVLVVCACAARGTITAAAVIVTQSMATTRTRERRRGRDLGRVAYPAQITKVTSNSPAPRSRS